LNYLRKFNEEIDPEKYIRTGQRLAIKHPTKAQELIDYGLEKKFGFLDTIIQRSDASDTYIGQVTDPQCQFYFGFPSIVNGELKNGNLEEEQLVANWKNGMGSLGFSLSFSVRPSEKMRQTHKHITFLRSSYIHLFDIQVMLSYWGEGIREYNYLEDEDRYIQEGEADYVDLDGLWDNTKTLDINLAKGLCPAGLGSCYGIFFNRQSAWKFKKLLPQLINPHVQKNNDLMSLLGAKTDEVEDIIKSICDISTNRFFNTEHTKGRDLHRIWFYNT
jgi:hypothetical protein